jgi:hypothetical protein
MSLNNNNNNNNEKGEFINPDQLFDKMVSLNFFTINLFIHVIKKK